MMAEKIDKIIKSLETCQNIASNCIDCPYNEYYTVFHDCVIKLHNDAAELLKDFDLDLKLNNLKPCPFCGNTKIIVDTIANIEMIDEPDDYQSSHFMAVCSYNEGGCGSATGAMWQSKELAIEAWNRRTE